MRTWILAAALSLLAKAALAGTVGYEQRLVPVPGDRPVQVGIWYPADALEAVIPLALGQQSVARDAPVVGRRHALIVISHGTGGSFSDHADTARALAEAGFVAAAVSHTGDTFDDKSRVLRALERPRHLRAVIDYMTGPWRAAAQIDKRRIGAFGFSAGGFTVLAALGGEPDMSLLGPHCAAHPTYFDCQLSKVFAGQPFATSAAGAYDPRIHAAVIAAPALGFTFAPNGLAKVKAPIQLWRAENDTILPHPDYAEAVRNLLPRKPDYRVVPGADHFDFLQACTPALKRVAPQICQGTFDRTAFHAGFNADVVAFFRKTLR